MARPKITVIVDGGNVTVKGNTADVQLDVQVIGLQPTVTNNTVDRHWYERWWGIVLIGLVVTVAGGGAILLPRMELSASKITVKTPPASAVVNPSDAPA